MARRTWHLIYDPIGIAFIVIICVLAALLIALNIFGCTSLRPPSTPYGTARVAAASTDRCETLDDRSSLFGGVAEGSAILAGAGGLSTVATSDPTLRTTLAISSLAFGAIAAGAGAISHSAATTFTREGCAR